MSLTVSLLILCLLVGLFIAIWLIIRPIYESFEGSLLSWEFTSPKSSLKNYNETTEIRQPLNQLQASNSHEIDPMRPLPLWVYPYTYVNRHFDYILMTLAHQIEKDFNRNARLSERHNEEWSRKYPYVEATWGQLPPKIKYMVIDLMAEINRRFNMDVPVVGYRHDRIKYHWLNDTELIVVVSVYKRYTVVGLDPAVASERDLLMSFDRIDADGGYHVKYLRFPDIDYEHDDTLDDLPYAKEFDQLFYLSRSKDPRYRMLSNTEARDLYVMKALQKEEKDGIHPVNIRKMYQSNDQENKLI
jgi:hypothetical protein